MNNKAIIPVSAGVCFAVIVMADIEENGSLPTTKEWLGFTVAFTMISAASDLGFPAASGFALLAMVGVALNRGPEALSFLNGKFSGKKAKTNTKKKAAAVSKTKGATSEGEGSEELFRANRTNPNTGLV